jgi:hypothetical protein
MLVRAERGVAGAAAADAVVVVKAGTRVAATDELWAGVDKTGLDTVDVEVGDADEGDTGALLFAVEGVAPVVSDLTTVVTGLTRLGLTVETVVAVGVRAPSRVALVTRDFVAVAVVETTVGVVGVVGAGDVLEVVAWLVSSSSKGSDGAVLLFDAALDIGAVIAPSADAALALSARQAQRIQSTKTPKRMKSARTKWHRTTSCARTRVSLNALAVSSDLSSRDYIASDSLPDLSPTCVRSKQPIWTVFFANDCGDV